MSIKTKYARLIFDGHKTVEVRRRLSSKSWRWDRMYVYSSGEDKAVIGRVDMFRPRAFPVEEARKHLFWMQISEEEFDDYCKGVDEVWLIELYRPKKYKRPISLERMRKIIPGFRPPQSHLYLSEEDVDGIEWAALSEKPSSAAT